MTDPKRERPLVRDLFGRDVPPPPDRRPRADLAHPAAPGSGPAGKRCRTCRRRFRDDEHSQSRAFWKCVLRAHLWTRGRGTDIHLKDLACSFYAEGPAVEVEPPGAYASTPGRIAGA